MDIKHNKQDMTLSELARITGYHHKTLLRLAGQGKLPGAYKLGQWRVRREAVAEMRGTSTSRE